MMDQAIFSNIFMMMAVSRRETRSGVCCKNLTYPANLKANMKASVKFNCTYKIASL